MRYLLILIACLFLSACWTTGAGEKIGSIVKIAKEGVICKTWEVQLIRGGMNGGSGSFGVTPFNFVIENEDLLKKAQDALTTGSEVIIKYHHEAVTFCRNEGDDNNFLDDIQAVSKK